MIIIDNVLWHGEVADEDNMDKFTLNIRELNEHVSTDKGRTNNYPIRRWNDCL